MFRSHGLSSTSPLRFRLTRNATCPRVAALLLDPTGPLASLHSSRISERCELMKLADVNSNKKGGGGTSEFRDLQTRVIEMAPEMWKARIRDVPFLAKTKGIHGAAIDDIIDEILHGSSEAEPQPIQDVAEAGVSVDPVLAPAVSVKEPLQEKVADAADCQECLVAAEGVAESLRDSTPPKVQVEAGEAAEPEPKKPRMMMKLGLWRFRLTGWFGGGGGGGGGCIVIYVCCSPSQASVCRQHDLQIVCSDHSLRIPTPARNPGENERPIWEALVAKLTCCSQRLARQEEELQRRRSNEAPDSIVILSYSLAFFYLSSSDLEVSSPSLAIPPNSTCRTLRQSRQKRFCDWKPESPSWRQVPHVSQYPLIFPRISLHPERFQRHFWSVGMAGTGSAQR